MRAGWFFNALRAAGGGNIVMRGHWWPVAEGEECRIVGDIWTPTEQLLVEFFYSFIDCQQFSLTVLDVG